jgi:natural resistance-associated macrophage protein
MPRAADGAAAPLLDGADDADAKAQYMPDDLVTIPDEGDVTWRTCYINWRTLWLYTGPGWLMSLAYLDPGNLEADLQMGAYSGTQLIWVLAWSTVMGLVLQLLAARLGVGTGLNLAQQCRLHYPRRTSLALWALTEIAIIGSDIQEIVGTAIAFQILFGFPLWLG